MKTTLSAILAALIAAAPVSAQTTGTAGVATPQPKVPAPTQQGLYFKPDAGIVYQSGDFRLTAWGFAERLIDPDGPDTFRRVRQGAEIDLPRISEHFRVAGVYEIDLTDTNAFGINPGPRGLLNSHDFENLFVAVQDADDPAKFRLLLGHNTSILSRDDNLSSGNLPTINRSLILEEHGSTNTFGAQLGVQVQKMLSPKVTLLASIGDNRGGLNAQQVKSSFGRAVAVSRTDGPARDKSVWRVPAGDLEAVVTGRLRSLLLDEGQLLDALASPELDAVSTQTAMFEAKQLAHNIAVMASGDVRQSILKFVRRVEVHQSEVRLEIDRDELHALSRSPHPEHDSGVLNLVVPATIARIGREMRLVVPPTREIHAVNKDPGLIKLIVKAHAARRAAEGQCDRSFGELARDHGYDRDYFGVLLRLSYLAPSLTLQILEGRQPPSLTRQLLARAAKVPMEWSAQCGQFEICSSGPF